MTTETRDAGHTVTRYDADCDPVVRFLGYLDIARASFPTLYETPYFRWKTTTNPFGPSACFLRYDGGVAAAHVSYTAKPANPALGCAAAAELGDTHTHPDFQRRGHFGAVGRWAIDDCIERARPAEALIYGLPNDNALPGWTRHCGCELFTELAVREMVRRPRVGLARWPRDAWGGRRPGHLSFTRCPDDVRTAVEIDALWDRAEETGACLLRKTGAWWRWRYVDASERYQTFGMRARSTGALRAYVVAKISGRLPRIVHVCEVFGESPAAASDAFDLFMARVVRATDLVTTWTQAGTPLAAAVARFGFAKRRDVPVMFAGNDAYRRLRTTHPRVWMSLGDTDNV